MSPAVDTACVTAEIGEVGQEDIFNGSWKLRTSLLTTSQAGATFFLGWKLEGRGALICAVVPRGR